MKRSPGRAISRIILIALIAAWTAQALGLMAAEQASAVGVEFFEKRVRPILAEHCYECHSAAQKKSKAGLSLDSVEGLIRGGDSGPLFSPGKPQESRLLKAVQYSDPDLQMPPPKDGVSRKLTPAQIEGLAQWIEIGAPLPTAPLLIAKAPTTKHWAFVAPAPSTPPSVRNTSWPQNALDRFILAALEAKGLEPAPVADKRTLLRRATYDLTGLPPTKKEADDFMADRSPAAFSRVVDRLLNSPHYGERWGRLWLDVARYADTKGYVYGREERFFVHAWAYRDWVVNAFNRDVPYDRFLKLQIAADQMVPANSPDLAAIGFITGGRRFIGVTRDIIDDRIDVLTRGTMALTVSCARCHDHKYDPIPTRDYYSLYGVFDASHERLVSLGEAPQDAEFKKLSAKFSETMQKRRAEASARLQARVGDYLVAQLELEKYPDEGFDQIFSDTDIIPASVRRWRDFLGRVSQEVQPLFAPWHALSKIDPQSFSTEAPLALNRLFRDHGAKINPLVAAAFAVPPKDMREAALRYGKLFADAQTPRDTPEGPPGQAALLAFLADPKSPTSVPDTSIVNNDQFFPTAACEEIWKLQGDLERWLIRAKTPLPYALALEDREPERDPRVFIRGNPGRLGEPVKRRFPSAIAGAHGSEFHQGSGRLELANAIANPANPLTARVMVNRIWQGHFGAGLVRTVSDFGLRAEDPSHPALLDWLALQFIDAGWSVKLMHRLIMLSSTYRQSSVANAPLTDADPDNRLLSRFPRARLGFEEMRDSVLASSGELDKAVGGKSSDLFANGNKRRTIYGLVDRQFLPAAYRVFDFANPDLHVGQRHSTTVPQQALFFLNNDFVGSRARALAKLAASQGEDPKGRISALYSSVYQRGPSRAELARGLAFIKETSADLQPPQPKPVRSQWQYGWGEFDAATKQVKSFRPLPHFNGKAWQGGSDFPDPALGWVQLTALGGHPGNDLQHAAIRRWTAPTGSVVSIRGELVHEPSEGDGIRAFMVSSRTGELKAATAHHSRESMAIDRLEVSAGETIDFIVDVRGGLNSDQFLWAPTISPVAEGSVAWDAQKDFAGPPPAYSEPLGPWAQYAQALLLANEFLFVD